MLIVADPVSGNYVEVWQASVDSTTHTVTPLYSWGPGWATGNAITGPGAGTLTNNDGVRATNFSVMGGMITASDLAAGRIDHALQVALPADMATGGTPNPGVDYRAPATSSDWTTTGGPIMYGSRIGIPAGVARPAGLSPIGNMVFDALQKYGAFVGDACGGSWPMFVADKGSLPNATLDPSDTANPFHPLIAYWAYSGSSDMEKIGPLLRVANYQP
jgi:hypothetical protein